jgi:hypothetical protein
MRKVIGNKKLFAIEYEIQPGVSHVMGNVRLWLEGVYIGAIEDVNILSAILCQLEVPRPEIHENCGFVDKDADDVYELVYVNDVLENARHSFTPGEAFDDFSIVVFSCDGYFYFVWKLEDNAYFSYPDYPEGVQSGRVSISEYYETVSEFSKVLSQNVP